MSGPRAYEVNGAAASGEHFIRVACDPLRSVVVEACAGSGKTWLLVARMLRLLLAGAEPAELLAITFTHKAAQEMRERLIHLLRDLALRPDQEVRALLLERGVAERDLAQLLPAARGLYERVLASPQSLSIDTFHSWFARLLQIAPLSSGVPHGYALAESTGELRMEAYGRFMQSLDDDNHRETREALISLYEMVGDWNVNRLLDAFVEKRAEWWAATRHAPEAPASIPLMRLYELCGEDVESDARLSLWEDEQLCARIMRIASLLGEGGRRNQERAALIARTLSAGPGAENFLLLLAQFCDDKGEPRGNDHRRGRLLAAVGRQFGGPEAFEREFAAIARHLQELQRRSFEPMVLAQNGALFAAGSAYLDRYQEVKAEQRVLDFSDLEWHAYRLLTNEEHAAYLHSRLDARYKHILLDEFQDTNPLQWSIVRAWLNAYGGDAEQPSVFIVGDPKQSIYRFRRAEPRVFAAARDLLAARGADILRTSQTRRNAAAIIDALNTCFVSNPIFAPQATLAGTGGAVWRLPLIRREQLPKEVVPVFVMRDPLSAPREEEEDARRLDEGRAVAQAIVHARRELTARQGREAGWSDVMLLVKKRTYLTAYESALREAGIPFISDKRGGLLESIEVADLIALLSFLITPGDNRALAHVLKSPIMGAGDDDLIALAGDEGPWWPRMRLAARDGASEAMRRAARLLEQWLAAAPRLPVHDLLDLILHQGRLIARYAQATPAAMRKQVVGNIEAFTELALNLDAGRYPSLPKFIDALRMLRKGADTDAPDEASIDATTDAVRILTIHGAKGLEAPIVALLDANHSEPARDDLGILCDWPQDSDAPTHFSAFGRREERGLAREALFAAEDGFRMQEDWNLLYVAATRAQEILIVSGVAGGRGALADGIIEGSWYQRLQAVPALAPEVLHDALRDEGGAEEESFELPVFDPPALPPADAVRSGNCAADEDIALRAALERLTQHGEWPIAVPDAATLARWLPCPHRVAVHVREWTLALFGQPGLERFFNPAHYTAARNELELMADGEILRFDRVVLFDDETWVINYKRELPDSERFACAAQLARHRTAVQMVFPGKRLKAALIVADGRLLVDD